MLRYFLAFSFCSFLLIGHVPAQEAPRSPLKINFHGFIDIYYVYDFNQPTTDYRQTFLYNHNRHNKFNINMALAQVNLEHEKYRAHIGLHAGTYSIDNYAKEHPFMQHVFEANAGAALNKKNTVWLDAGIMPSHIGFESAMSLENLTLTRSLLAENSPYFLTGAKLSWRVNENTEIALLALNGWQRIRRLPGNSLVSWGSQFSYTVSSKLLFNWSTFIGTDDPDISRHMRYFNNFYLIYEATDNFKMIAGSDIGLQQVSRGSKEYDSWITPVGIVQYKFTKQWSASVRGEYFSDKNEVIISIPGPEAFQTGGFSLNVDFLPKTKFMLRLEGRLLQSREEIFQKNNQPKSSNFIIASSAAIGI